MFDLLVEGFAAIRLPCTLAVLVPGIGATLVSRSRAPLAVAGFVAGAGLVGWARFADLWFEPPGLATMVALGALVAGTLVATHGDTKLAPLAGVAAGLTAGWMWVPCVGEHLAEPLNEATTNRAGTIGPIVVYIVGVSLPLLAAAALPHAAPMLQRWRDDDRVARAGLAIGVVVAAAIAAGFYGDLVTALAPDGA